MYAMMLGLQTVGLESALALESALVLELMVAQAKEQEVDFALVAIVAKFAIQELD